MNIEAIERRIVSAIAAGLLLIVLAAFAGVMLTHRNTLAMVAPLVRWIQPSASSAEIVRIHDMARKFGHFLIPAAAYASLISGPLRRRPLAALGLCALFAGIDELMQAFNPARNGSILDVMLDMSGAIFAYFVDRAMVASRGAAAARASRDRTTFCK